jgi:hypothetical protein
MIQWNALHHASPRTCQTMSVTLVLKLFLVPTLIYLITLAGRRWGPAVAGWLSAFPVVAGPILLTITLEHGPVFAAAAAEGTLAAVLATLMFCIAYAWASARTGVAGSFALALPPYVLAVAVLNAVHPPPLASFVVVIGVLCVAPRLFPRVAPLAATGRAPRDMGWRMLSAAALVLAVTFGADRLGPRLSGILAMFPVMGSVLTGFTHAYQGRDHAVALLRGMALGYFAFAAFCFAIISLLPGNSIAVAFGIAFVFALGVQVGIKAVVAFWRKRSANPTINPAPSIKTTRQ